MKILKKNLIAALDAPASVAKGKTTSPILSTVRLEASNNTLQIIGSDQVQFSQASAECAGDLAPCCVPVHQLRGVLPLLPDEIECSLNGKLELGSLCALSVLKAEEFPAMPQAGIKVGIPCEDLALGIEKVMDFTPANDYRPALMGIHVKSESKSVVVEAIDGKQLARMQMNLISAPCEFTVPPEFARGLTEALCQPEAVLSLSDKMVSVKHKTGEYACGLMENCYVDSSLAWKPEREELGIITPSKWKPIVQAAISMAGTDKNVQCRILVTQKGVEYAGDAGNISVPLPEPLLLGEQELKMNATAFLKCLGALDDAPVKLSHREMEAVAFSQGDLLVMTSQVR